MQWHNEPARWQTEGDAILVTSEASTDFWRKTHDGGIRDNGHLYGETVSGDFTAEVRVSADYNTLYDQAGLMARLDETTWIKCGVEYMDGVQYASAVITRDYSDWSVVTIPSPPALWLRLVRHGGTFEVHFSLDGQKYTMLRQGWVTDAPVQVGVMVATPKRGGLQARFEGFRVTAG